MQMGNIADFIASLKRRIADSEDAGVNALPFENDKIAQIMDYYQLKGPEIYKLFHVFRKMDVEGTGYINLDNLYYLLGEEIGIISPYLERFFSLIQKQNPDKANFLEFLPVLATFCLFTKEQIVSFVFSLLDHDNDGYISKKDMLTFASTERFGLPIFPQNFLISIDSVELERPDKISAQIFTKIEQEILFLIYPAIRLQQSLRREFGGEDMWENVYKRLLRVENEEEKKQQQEYFNEELRKKRAKRSALRRQEFEEMLKNKIFFKRFVSETKNLPPREFKRRGSDSRVATRLEPLVQIPKKRHNSQLYFKKEFQVIDSQKSAEPDENNNPAIPAHIRRFKIRETQKHEKRRGSRSITVSEKKLGYDFSTPKQSQDSNYHETLSNNSSQLSQQHKSGEKLLQVQSQQPPRRPSVFRSNTVYNN